jgi:hypothetical protein
MNPKSLACFIFLGLLLSVSWKRYPETRKNSINEITTFVKDYIESYNHVNSPEINLIAYSLALKGISNISEHLGNDSIITLIDYSLPSTTERLFVIDIKNEKLLLKLHVAHGKNTGVNYAQKFSNRKGSNMSSLGFFITQNTYIGKHGYSLRLDGLESSNNRAYDRAIVIHGAHYVSEAFIKAQGRLGRSFGCPAISYAVSRQLIDTIKNGSCLFIYYPDEDYLANSEVLMLGENNSQF